MQQNVWLEAGDLKIRVVRKVGNRVPGTLARNLQTVGVEAGVGLQRRSNKGRFSTVAASVRRGPRQHAAQRQYFLCRMAPLHSQGCEGAAYPRLDTRMQSPEKTITNWFLFLFPPVVSLHRLPPKILPLGFRAGALNSHLCLGQGGARGSSSPSKAHKGRRKPKGGQKGPGARGRPRQVLKATRTPVWIGVEVPSLESAG